MNAIESVKHYSERISAELNNCLTETSLFKVPKRTGKVRDQYDLGDKIALITTARQSALFVVTLPVVPVQPCGPYIIMATGNTAEISCRKD